MLRDLLTKMGIDADTIIEKAQEESMDSADPASDNCGQDQNTASMEDEKMSDQ